MTAYASEDGRVVIGPAEIGNEIFARYDEQVKAWRWFWYTRGVTIGRDGWKRSSRTGEIIR